MTRLLERPAFVCALYVGLACVMTWPVAAGLTRDLPSDLGDPLFVSGMLTWASKHWIDLLGGDLSAVRRFWNAPFFYPETLATAFSEHFVLHSLLTLPIYLGTENIVLCYNVLFLAAFALSGFGMFLFVRELTGRPLAAFVAGLAFAFAPYRFATIPHLQVISTQWMGLALFAFRRYFVTGRLRPLAGGALALWAQNMSSGYYMVYFGPFVALYVLAEIAIRQLWGHLKVWGHVVLAAGAVLAATIPFGIPYLTLQQRYHYKRSLAELTYFSADLLGWLTASPSLRLWGGLRTFDKAEGHLFPGVTVVILAVVGLAYGWRHVRRREHADRGAAVAAVFGTFAIVLSFWMSLGPQVQLRTQPLGVPALYALAYRYIPGYDVARVPARFAMIAAFALAAAAGVGLAAIERRRRWPVVLFGFLVLAEGTAVPLPVNLTWTSDPAKLLPPPSRVFREREIPPVYKYLRTLDNAVVAHLPFGAPEREIQYVYYSTIHGRRIINGYSGMFPPTYQMRAPDMLNAAIDPRAANERMIFDGVTVLVLHSGAYDGEWGRKLVAVFDNSRGFERLARFGDDYVYRLHY
jgi:hypothetical protein